MKVYGIVFSGIWPVGASAVVVAGDDSTPEDAAGQLRAEWARKYPDAKQDLDPEVFELPQPSVTILQNGDY